MNLPTGTATFVFTDIEGSTRMVQELGVDRWRAVLEGHHALLREVWTRFEGHEVNTEGDAFFVAFPSAANAVAACAEGQRRLAAHQWPEGVTVRVRMGVHTGEALVTAAADYLGIDVHRAARIASAGHGGQVLVSETTRALVLSSLPEGVSLDDMGEHRLKDLARAEHIYQLVITGLASDFPALKSLDATPNNLPTQMTTFVGRDTELAEAHRLLHDVRLLTLTGPGGTGKTRLSVQLAADMAHEFEGVYWVPLAPIENPDLVATTIAQALGLQENGQRTPLEMIIQHLGSRKLMLVLDNFEQVTAAAPTIGEILKGAPAVKMIVSSRAPLRVYGEQEFPVPPLGVPDIHRLPPLESLSQYAAVKLFIDRATSIKPDFRIDAENAPAIAEITDLVDGLPLAVELAAARIRVLSPRQMLARLQNSLGDLGGGARDLPARQQTLRGAINWSYDMLEPATQRLMARFGVFARGATLEHAELVCSPDGDVGVDVLDGLEQLLEQSLVRTLDSDGGPRFFMLHVIREFALDRLAEAGEADLLRQRHAQTYLEFAEAAAPKLMGEDQTSWLETFEAEQDNIRAALSWFIARGDAVEASRMVFAQWRHWHMRGHVREGRQRIDQVVGMDFAADQRSSLLKALEAGGGITWWEGDRDTCRAYYERAVALARDLGDQAALAQALYNLSFPLGELDPAKSILVCEEALELFRGLGDEVSAARVEWSIAGSMGIMEKWEESLPLLRSAGTLFRQEGLRFDLSWALHSLGLALVKLGRSREAAPALTESMKMLSESGDQAGMSVVLGDFSDLAFGIGLNLDGMRLRGASQALQQLTGAALEGALGATYNQRYRQTKEFSDEELAALDEGLAMSADEALAQVTRLVAALPE